MECRDDAYFRRKNREKGMIKSFAKEKRFADPAHLSMKLVKRRFQNLLTGWRLQHITHFYYHFRGHKIHCIINTETPVSFDYT